MIFSRNEGQNYTAMKIQHAIFLIWYIACSGMIEASDKVDTGESDGYLQSIIPNDTVRKVDTQASFGPNPNDNGTCKLKLDTKSISQFRHDVYYREASVAYLRLKPGPGVRIVGDRFAVGPHLWVWTFYGNQGGLEILSWPIEYGIWSMGLLTPYVIQRPIPMELHRVAGNCSDLNVGRVADNEVISKALVALADVMNNVTKSDKYGPSFFCHTTRQYIKPHFLYMLCKHIVCPLEAVKYSCCSNFYNVKEQTRQISGGCDHEFVYDPISWVLPTLISVILFVFSPMLLMYIVHILWDGQTRQSTCQLHNVVRHSFPVIEDAGMEDFIFYSDRPSVTFFNTILSPVYLCFNNVNDRTTPVCRSIVKRLFRCFLPFLSLSFICIQVALDHKFLYSLVVKSIEKGVPMGFRSVIAGYEGSKCNFLAYLGGPYVAVGAYLFIACIVLCIPDNISETLLSGIPKDNVDTLTPLSMRLKYIHVYGSENLRNRQAYGKLLSVLQAQFFMLINVKYWKHVLGQQYDRWVHVCNRLSGCCVLTPFYILLCFIELILCIAFNGCPILSFSVIVIKAYCGNLMRHGFGRGCIFKSLFCLLAFVVVLSMVYFLFMFCTIFMDACLFITRVVTFTFTGVVAHPKIAYGYIIFFCTVVYYMGQCFHDFSGKYQTLLRETIAVCEKLQRANDSPKLVAKYDGLKGVRSDLFENVIEVHAPRRKQVFVSMVKVTVILTVLGLSLNVLIETDGFRELHVVMHVGTALFICALPHIMNTMCRRSGEKYRLKKLRRQIACTVKEFQGRYENSDTSCDSDC